MKNNKSYRACKRCILCQYAGPRRHDCWLNLYCKLYDHKVDINGTCDDWDNGKRNT